MQKRSLQTGDTKDALTAAGVAVWQWKGESNLFSLRSHGGSESLDLEGDWQLEDFLTTIDGMSRQRLSQRLLENEHSKRLDLTLMLADGRRLHLLGAFVGDRHAQGLLYTSGMEPAVNNTLPVEAAFQPIIRLKDGMIAGFEALARWRDNSGELRPAGAFPDEFGRMIHQQLATTMLEQAGRALADWTKKFPSLNLFVQVNLTGADLYRADVLEKVTGLVQSGLFKPDALRIELTEQMALRDFEAGVAAATALQASGAGLILDDFGSGHSSLAWLAAIPASGIKIDPQLTQMAGTPKVDTILSSVARLAGQLGMTVTAEGIEDLDKVHFLKGIGCDYVQGFAYARPMEKGQADRFLESQLRLRDIS